MTDKQLTLLFMRLHTGTEWRRFTDWVNAHTEDGKIQATREEINDAAERICRGEPVSQPVFIRIKGARPRPPCAAGAGVVEWGEEKEAGGMTEFYIPTGPGEAELTEKRSRFIGRVRRAETEEQARAFMEAVRKKEYDAAHNCWCYVLHGGGERCSDDGEPQGTAGQPMLAVLRREGIENACCVVTRYFGGVLLGAGGLVRAYTAAAKAALDAAGVSVVRRWIAVDVSCPYPLLETLRRQLAGCGGAEEGVTWGAQALLHALLPEEQAACFRTRVIDLTAGAVVPEQRGERLRDVPVRKPG